MCSPQGIIDNTIGKAVDAAFQAVKCAIHYKKNHKDLKDEMEKFKEYREDIERKVDDAQNRGEDIATVVSRWRREADEMTQDFENFMQQCSRKESMRCFACSCPNFIWRYQLSKQAQEKKDNVTKLKQEGHFDEIARPKPPPPELPFLSDHDYEIFDSRASVFKMVVAALKDSKVTVISVHGTGGVGKTTLVKEVSKQLKEDGTFDEVVMAVVSQNVNVSKIQSQLVGSLDLDLKNATTEEQISYQLWHRLNNGKKNLVILDDIWEEVNLKAIGIPVTDGNKGCKVVITSRNRGVRLIKNKVDRDFALPLLPELEAWALFKTVAGNSVDSHELYSLAYAVCKECKGLPVAIKALGAALNDKEIFAWRTALEMLKNSKLSEIEGIDPTVYTSLKLSFEELKSPYAKSCFLHCCLFPEDAEISIDDLTRLCMARSLLYQNADTLEKARDAVCTAVGTLKTCYLLLDDTDEGVVKMHDIIRDVGISIEREFLVEHGVVREWPKRRKYESYSAISIRCQSMDELPNELACPQLRILMLESNNRSLLKVPDGFFSGMKELEVIDFNRMCMSPLPSSLPKLANLQMLCLSKCKLVDISVLKDLQGTLEMLSLRGSDIEVLPPEIGSLTRLRLLDLRDCGELKVIPHGVISNLTCLEELYFSDTFYQWDKKKTSGNVSLDELRSLTRLTTLHVYIPKDMLFPKEFSLNFENLDRFKIMIGGPFVKENSARFLKLEGVPLKDELNTLVEKAEGLCFSKVDGLKNVFHNRGGGEWFLNLKYLEVKYCYDLVDPLFGKLKSRSFNKLRKLTIGKCRSKYLFSLSSIRGLLQLECLSVWNCEILEGIVGFEGEKDEDELIYFSKLKFIKLMHLPNLKSFYPKLEKTTTTLGNSSIHEQPLFNEKVAFPALETLIIDTCSQITNVWDKKILPANSFFMLRFMTVFGCDNLVNVFQSNMVSRLENLQDVSIKVCPAMEVIISKKGEEEGDEGAEPNGLILFPRLRTMDIFYTKNLKSFYNSSERSDSQPLFNHQVAFPALEILEIDGCSQITNVWDKKMLPVESFFELRELTVECCDNLVNVFQSNMISRLQNLQKVSIVNCRDMEVIISKKGEEEGDEGAEPNDNIVLPQLRKLKLKDLKNLKHFCTTRSEAGLLFNHKVAFPALEILEIDGCLQITNVWDKKMLPVESFFQLRELTVECCDNLVNVFQSNMISRLQNLQKVSIVNCREMEVIILKKGEEEGDERAEPNDNIVLPQLRNLYLQSLENLKSFCTTRAEAGLLFNHKLHHITSQVAFPALEILEIDGCSQITNVWDKKMLPVESFFELRELTVECCDNLVNVFQSNMISRLQNLQKVSIVNCRDMEVIISKKGEEEGDEGAEPNDNIVLPQLRKLKLKDLKNLKHFCTTRSEAGLLFNHKVAFPALEILEIDGCSQITNVWDKKMLPVESFFQLRELTVECCDNLVNVFQSNMISRLQNLQKVSIVNCRDMEVIILKKGEEEGDERAEPNDNIVLPQLRNLYLQSLENLKSFCTTRSEAGLLFNHKVAFPALEILEIDGCSHITNVWDKKMLPVESFFQLRELTVECCDNLVNVFQSNMISRLQNLQKVSIVNCRDMEVIISKKGEEEGDEGAEPNDNIVLPQLRKLKLKDLKNLKHFCTTRSEAGLLFNHKVVFPVLNHLKISSLPSITEIWSKQTLPDPKEEVESFFQLISIVVDECNELVSVIPSHMLSQLQKLQELFVRNCPKIETIVSKKTKEEKVLSNDIIVFPELSILELGCLEKLKSFCTSTSEAQLFFNNKVAFPKLLGIFLDDHLEKFREGIYAEEECIALGEEEDNEEEDKNRDGHANVEER